MYPDSNFEVWLSDDKGRFVPGSYRKGHNVFTNAGRNWLRNVAAWTAVGSPMDQAAPGGLDRFRWIGVGTGTQFEQVGVSRLVTPLEIDATPTYIRALAPPTFNTTCALLFVSSFSGSDFAPAGAFADVSEAGIYVDHDAGFGPGLLTTNPSNVPVAYKAFAPIRKYSTQTLTITWEFRF